MSMTSTICRSVINTRDVIKNKNITTLLETLSLETGFTNEKIVKLCDWFLHQGLKFFAGQKTSVFGQK